ncbi:MAG: outer membrane protein assembly factor BamD [Cyclobacteriaceae bacterium]|nr:outer membrane protein assembly factor BamD [Cyclobacteriaceae bacterium]
MRSITKGRIFGVLLAVLLLFGCSDFRKLQKSTDWREKYDAAVRYYERGEKSDYIKASILFEEILPLIRGTEEAEKANFYYAYCHFHQTLYVESAFYFKNFYETYSRSEFAREAMYLHAHSLFLDSPVVELDQSSSEEAITAMQQFLNRFPNSEYTLQANNTINELQIKLEKKAYSNAVLYKKLSQHNSAVIAFENFNKDYPDSQLNEEINFLKLESQYLYARRSISTRQKERYELAIDFYNYFIENYANSTFAKDARKIYDDCRKWIDETAAKKEEVDTNSN